MANLTITLDDEQLIREAKILAAKRGMSISAIMRDYLMELIAKESTREQAMHTAMRMMKQGFHLGGAPMKRNAIHDRTLD